MPGGPVSTVNRGFPGGNLPPKYQTRYVLVSLIDKRPLSDRDRFVFRLDEVDPERRLKVEGLYFCYLDVVGGRGKMLARMDDDDVGHHDGVECRSLPFPFFCTLPPRFGLLDGSALDGVLDFSGRCLEFKRHRVEIDGHGYEIGIEASYRSFHALSADVPAVARCAWGMWLGRDVTRVLSTDAEARSVSSEVQGWRNAGDLFWERMEQHNPDGVLMMRCTRLDAGGR
jgi:hypothetical protein